MPGKQDHPAMRVVVAADASTAELQIPAAFPTDLRTVDVCLSSIQQAGVAVNSQVRKAVTELLETSDTDGPVQGVIATRQAPEHGIDGRIEWEVDKPAVTDDQAEEGEAPVAADETTSACHYSRSNYIMVKPGDILGIVHPPTPGTDGVDVRGKAIAAKQGKVVALKHDESLLIDASGRITAQQEGVLFRQADRVGIRKLIEVGDNVDFSTGNIDFDGDVIVRKSVKDCFLIRVTGSVEVHGLIEAASIQCGGDMRALGGFAGRERGNCTVGGNLQARYLDEVNATVRGDLLLEREAINCHLTVAGKVDAGRGAVIGGELTVTGEAHVGTVGSGAGVETRIVLGSVPTLEPILDDLEDLVDRIEAESKKYRDEDELIRRNTAGGRATAHDRERQTELMFEMANLDTRLKKATRARDRVAAKIDKLRCVELNVGKRLHAGVRLILGRRIYCMRDDLRGPLQVTADRAGDLIIRRPDGGSTALNLVADVQANLKAA